MEAFNRFLDSVIADVSRGGNIEEMIPKKIFCIYHLMDARGDDPKKADAFRKHMLGAYEFFKGE